LVQLEIDIEAAATRAAHIQAAATRATRTPNTTHSVALHGKTGAALRLTQGAAGGAIGKAGVTAGDEIDHAPGARTQHSTAEDEELSCGALQPPQEAANTLLEMEFQKLDAQRAPPRQPEPSNSEAGSSSSLEASSSSLGAHATSKTAPMRWHIARRRRCEDPAAASRLCRASALRACGGAFFGALRTRSTASKK